MLSKWSFLVAVFGYFTNSVIADATCHSNQPRRDGDPSGSQISTALTINNQLSSVCAGTWDIGDKKMLTISFNHGGMIYNVSRTDNTQPLQYCMTAMEDIINECILDNYFWGGIWTEGDETYDIYNDEFPNNPLLSTDPGGPQTTTTTSTSSSSLTTNNAQGPITLGPQTSTETGSFSTTTKSINGLTANSATTTSADGHPTILPIWYLGPGLGIIVVPLAGVIPGGIIPPPVGYPPLTFGSDGNPTPAGPAQGQKQTIPSTTTTTTSSSSTCGQCTTCDMGTMGNLPTPTDLADIDPNFPLIVPGSPTPSFLTSSTSAAPTSPSLIPQSAKPIGSPTCSKNSAESIPNSIAATDANIDLNELLVRMRQQLCAGPCAAPSGIPAAEVAIYQNSAECEISVGISSTTEAFMYRGTAPDGPEWQQCWDSTWNIIYDCVKDGPNTGWWNGDYVYQFYQAGVRPLNDKSAKHTSSITAWPSLPTTGLTCDTNCVGYIPNPDWCAANCPCLTANTVCGARKTRSQLLRRETDSATCGAFTISYNLPDYPSTASSTSAANPPNGAADGIAAISKWWDRLDNNNPMGCTSTLNKFPQRQASPDGAPHEYATEHIWEKHFVKTFLNWLSFNPEGDGPVATCALVNAVFNTPSTTTGSQFNGKTPAQALANVVSCFGGSCPESNRVSEFYILESGINQVKTVILSKLSTSGSAVLPSCKATGSSSLTWQQMRTKMVTVSMAFEYMRDQDVFNIFNTVNTRFRNVLLALDADAFYGNLKPLPQLVAGDPTNIIQHLSWTNAYDYWMTGFLRQAEIKMQQWMFDCVVSMVAAATASGATVEANWALNQQQSGLFTEASTQFGTLYNSLMSAQWVD
ncbi:hypothetical protein N431DRAFT_520352 [Stipitochalara longipes BDJ]|nr:hypothetical protein N431DRAFT_520352 [Stipitochalara longipes BDJ]